MGKKEAAFTVKGKLSSKALRVSEALSWADLKVDLRKDFAEIDSEPLIAYGSSSSSGGGVGDHTDVVSDAASYKEMFSFVLGEMATGSKEVVVSLVTAREAKNIRERSERMADAHPSLAAVRRESGLSGIGGTGPSSKKLSPAVTPTAGEEKRVEVTPLTFMPGEGYVIYKPVMTWPSEELSMCAWARFSAEGAKQGTLLSYASRKKDDEIVLSRDAGRPWTLDLPTQDLVTLHPSNPKPCNVVYINLPRSKHQQPCSLRSKSSHTTSKSQTANPKPSKLPTHKLPKALQPSNPRKPSDPQPGGMLRAVVKGEMIEGKASIDDGQWHHICMTWSSISGEIFAPNSQLFGLLALLNLDAQTGRCSPHQIPILSLTVDPRVGLQPRSLSASSAGDVKLYLDGVEAGSKAKHRVGAKIEPSGSFVVGEGQKGGPGKIQGGDTSFSGDAAEVQALEPSPWAPNHQP